MGRLKSHLLERKAALQRLGMLGFGLGIIIQVGMKKRPQLNLRAIYRYQSYKSSRQTNWKILMNDETIHEIRRKNNILKLFIQNVAIAGVGNMNDDDTRSQFDLLYYEIQECLHDEKMTRFAPPLPHLGTYLGNQTLTSKHQTLIVHHGTMLLKYLEGVLDSYTPLTPISTVEFQYINRERINELKELEQTRFDLSKLIRLCEEINLCFSNRCFFSVILLVRAMLDHIPPIFQYTKFSEVANNYGNGGKSYKESMERLENSSRKLADGYLHNQIRRKENLPNETQVNYSNDIDLLLSEIIRLIKIYQLE